MGTPSPGADAASPGLEADGWAGGLEEGPAARMCGAQPVPFVPQVLGVMIGAAVAVLVTAVLILLLVRRLRVRSEEPGVPPGGRAGVHWVLGTDLHLPTPPPAVPGTDPQLPTVPQPSPCGARGALGARDGPPPPHRPSTLPLWCSGCTGCPGRPSTCVSNPPPEIPHTGPPPPIDSRKEAWGGRQA